MPDIPRPGQAVRGSERGQPIMALLDLLGRRWTLRVIWELRGEGTRLTFRGLQSACGAISSSVLNQRLAELRAAGVVDSDAGGYTLSVEGRRLLDLYPPLSDWADRWARRVASTASVAAGSDSLGHREAGTAGRGEAQPKSAEGASSPMSPAR